MPLVKFLGDDIDFPDSMSGDEITDVLGAMFASTQAVGEFAAMLGSGSIAEPISGITGLVTGDAGAVRGMQERLTYQPRTRAGQVAMQSISKDIMSLAEDTGLNHLSGYWRDRVVPALQEYAGPVAGSVLAAGGLAALTAISEISPQGRTVKAASRFDQRGIFAGVGARNADLIALEKAQKMAVNGAERGEIWKQTGWFNDADNQWKFEIDDSGFSLDPTKPEMGEFGFKTSDGSVFKHDELIANYPELSDNMKVSFEPELKSKGSYRSISESKILESPREHFIRLNDPASPRTNINGDVMRWVEKIDEWSKPGYTEKYAKDFEISLSEAKTEIADDVDYIVEKIRKAQDYDGAIDFNSGTRSVSAHELQHGTQEIEGFAEGGSPSEFAEKFRRERNYAESQLPFIIDDIAVKEQMLEFVNSLPDDNATKASRLLDYRNEIKELNAQKKALLFNRDVDITTEANRQYRNLAGEAEARNTQTRLNMTAEERAASPPWETLDVPEDEIIIRGSK